MEKNYTVEYARELMDGTYLIQINGIEKIYTIEDLQDMESIAEQIEKYLGL